MESIMSFQEYRNAKRPDFFWLVISAVMSFLFFLIDSGFKFPFHKLLHEKDVGRLIFVYYCIIFVSFWIVYFLSRQLGVQSLRFLLICTSSQWEKGNTSSKQQLQEEENQEEKNHQILVKEYQEKGKVTITAHTILIATSTLLIVNIYRCRIDVVDHDQWAATLQSFGLGFAVVAFVLLIFAVDCMETMFNSFKEKNLDMIHYFYAISLKPKYYGMLCVIVALILFVGSFMPTIASFGIGVLLLVGYKFWYPDPDLSDNTSKRNSFSFLFRVTMCLVPLAVTLRYAMDFILPHAPDMQ
jgi:protein-S-isoprenylcysteine O-methyltransferase Ste14